MNNPKGFLTLKGISAGVPQGDTAAPSGRATQAHISFRTPSHKRFAYEQNPLLLILISINNSGFCSYAKRLCEGVLKDICACVALPEGAAVSPCGTPADIPFRVRNPLGLFIYLRKAID